MSFVAVALCSSEFQPNSEYPDWLWTLLDGQPTREELIRESLVFYNEGGYDAVLENMSEEKLRRLFRLDARMRIKQSNAQGGLRL